MLVRYGEAYGESFPDIRPDGTVDIEELLAYETVSAYNTTLEDIEEVLRTSVETEYDGTLKFRFDPIRDDNENLTAMRACQGHSKYVQTLLHENAYMTPAYWGDPYMTEFLLHGTKKEDCARYSEIWSQGRWAPW